jgi:hypothetical protein
MHARTAVYTVRVPAVQVVALEAHIYKCIHSLSY